MLRRFGYRAGRLLALLAVCLQVVLPGALSVAQAQGIDVSRYFCMPSGETPGAEARAAALELARLFGEDAPGEAPGDGHCPLCTLAHGAPVPQFAILAAPPRYSAGPVFQAGRPGPVRETQGPPLGSRGPPVHV